MPPSMRAHSRHSWEGKAQQSSNLWLVSFSGLQFPCHIAIDNLKIYLLLPEEKWRLGLISLIASCLWPILVCMLGVISEWHPDYLASVAAQKSISQHGSVCDGFPTIVRQLLRVQSLPMPCLSEKVVLVSFPCFPLWEIRLITFIVFLFAHRELQVPLNSWT